MADTIKLIDSNKQKIEIDPAQIYQIGTWPSGQVNIFLRNEPMAIMAQFDAGDEIAILDIIQQEMQKAGLDAPILSCQPNAISKDCYRFLFNAKEIQSFSFETARRDNFNQASMDIAEKDLPVYLCIDGQSFGLPFTPSEQERDTFLKALRVNDHDWLNLAPNAPVPMNTTSGQFHIRKSAVRQVSGYLLGNAIIDLNNGSRLFVPIKENPKRQQHIAIAEQLGTLKPIIGPNSKAFVNPNTFDPDQVCFKEIDFGKGMRGTLMIYEDWHLPFQSTADAVKALETFVETYQNNPHYRVDLSNAGPEPDLN